MSTETSPIRIVVVDDHPVVRQGVAGLVGGQPDMSIARHRRRPELLDCLASVGGLWPKGTQKSQSSYP